MFVNTLESLEALGRIKFPADESFRSARFLTAADGMGYSYNENRVNKGTDLVVWLKHHWEANYIICGKGQVTDLSFDQSWALEAGVLYVVGPNDRHRLQITEDECHISIFCPPLTGNERFDSDGSYEASGPIEKTDRRMFVKHVDALRQADNAVSIADDPIQSVHLLTAADAIGFNVSLVSLTAGTQTSLGDKDHWQSNHIISGSARLTDVQSAKHWHLGPSMAYNVGPGDQHQLHVDADTVVLCVSASVAVTD